MTLNTTLHDSIPSHISPSPHTQHPPPPPTQTCYPLFSKSYTEFATWHHWGRLVSTISGRRYAVLGRLKIASSNGIAARAEGRSRSVSVLPTAPMYPLTHSLHVSHPQLVWIFPQPARNLRILSTAGMHLPTTYMNPPTASKHSHPLSILSHSAVSSLLFH